MHVTEYPLSRRGREALVRAVLRETGFPEDLSRSGMRAMRYTTLFTAIARPDEVGPFDILQGIDRLGEFLTYSAELTPNGFTAVRETGDVVQFPDWPFAFDAPALCQEGTGIVVLQKWDGLILVLIPPSAVARFEAEVRPVAECLELARPVLEADDEYADAYAIQYG